MCLTWLQTRWQILCCPSGDEIPRAFIFFFNWCTREEKKQKSNGKPAKPQRKWISFLSDWHCLECPWSLSHADDSGEEKQFQHRFRSHFVCVSLEAGWQNNTGEECISVRPVWHRISSVSVSKGNEHHCIHSLAPMKKRWLRKGGGGTSWHRESCCELANKTLALLVNFPN